MNWFVKHNIVVKSYYFSGSIFKFDFLEENMLNKEPSFDEYIITN